MALGSFKPLDGGMTVNILLTATVLAGEMVKLGGTLAGDGETAYGIAMKSGVSGDTIAVWRGPGRCSGTADTGVNFANGDRVYMQGTQKLDAGSTTNKSVGVVADTDPATAGAVIVDFDPWGTFAHA